MTILWYDSWFLPTMRIQYLLTKASESPKATKNYSYLVLQVQFPGKCPTSIKPTNSC